METTNTTHAVRQRIKRMREDYMPYEGHFDHRSCRTDLPACLDLIEELLETLTWDDDATCACDKCKPGNAALERFASPGGKA